MPPRALAQAKLWAPQNFLLVLILGRRFGLSPWTARLLFVLVLLVLPGSQFLVYPILWILMPSDDQVGVPVQHGGPAPTA